MVKAPSSLRADYWDNFKVQQEDLDYLYNILLELETPLTPEELALAVIKERIRIEKANLEKQSTKGGDLYLPKNQYEVGQQLVFPVFDWEKGKITARRAGSNPDLPPFEVIEVEFKSGQKRRLASGVAEHKLNTPPDLVAGNPLLDVDYIFKTCGDSIKETLETAFQEKSELVKIAGKWFPRALLVDVGVGYLNLAEAVLDMAGGGPLATLDLCQQIELPTDVNQNLTEFSLNLALQEDQRFDEVGPAGKVLWYLHRLEPKEVQETPLYLQFKPISYDRSILSPEMLALEKSLDDELSEAHEDPRASNEVTICVNYPHWRSGTLPLTHRVRRLFPTAYETSRIRFILKDGESGEQYPGWVVRPYRYVFGLRDWYTANGVIPGSLIHFQKSAQPGEIVVRIDKKRPTREWMRTVLIGADGGIVFAMLKQTVATSFDERMAIAVPDVEALDKVWASSTAKRTPMDQTVAYTVGELAKLNPQGHVHAQELYAAVNIMRRCSPGYLLYILASHPEYTHLGDLYFHLEESAQKEKLA